MPTPPESFLSTVHRLEAAQKAELQEARDENAQLRDRLLKLTAALQRSEFEKESDLTRLMKVQEANVALDQEVREARAEVRALQRENIALRAVSANLEGFKHRSE